MGFKITHLQILCTIDDKLVDLNWSIYIPYFFKGLRQLTIASQKQVHDCCITSNKADLFLHPFNPLKNPSSVLSLSLTITDIFRTENTSDQILMSFSASILGNR